MADRDVSPYLKINELTEQVNSHNRYIAEIDALFRTMAIDNSLWGWAARKLFQKYVRNSAPPSTLGIRKMDIPPIIPGTLEIKDESRHDNGNSRRPRKRRERDIGGTIEVHGYRNQSAQSDGG